VSCLFRTEFEDGHPIGMPSPALLRSCTLLKDNSATCPPSARSVKSSFRYLPFFRAASKRLKSGTMSQELSLDLETKTGTLETVGVTFLILLVAHACVDALGAMLPASLALFEVRVALSPEQSAWLLGLGSLTSGLAQPACAVVSDRMGTRSLGIWGVALAGLGIGLLGLAPDAVSLAVIYMLGMIGVGMFHPVGAATAGHLLQHRRTSAVSIFFVAGMAGGISGAVLGPRLLSLSSGFRMLPVIVVPVVILAYILQRRFATLEPMATKSFHDLELMVPRKNWTVVGILYLSAAMRFSVNMALLYLYVRWTQYQITSENVGWSAAEVARAAAPINGNLNAATLVGMALGGISAGVFVRSGREKWPMVLVPLVFAPVIALFPFVPMQINYLLAMLAGTGFAAMIPVTIALAQRLLPHRANFASSLMMGGAWAVAMVGPRLAELGVGGIGLVPTFLVTAAVLAVSGAVCVLIRVPTDTN